MHFKFGCKESADGCKECAQENTHYQCKNHSQADRHARKVKYMSENRTRVDSLMHDDGCRRHAHTDHTPDGKVRAGKENQACNTEGKKHSRRCLLQ